MACQEQELEKEAQSNRVIVAGQFVNLSKADTLQKIGLYVQDYLTKETNNFSQRLDSTNSFRFEFELSEVQDIILLPNEIVKLIIAPGDSVFVEIDAKTTNSLETLKGLEFSGSKAEVNEKLTQFWIQDPIDYQDFQKKRVNLNSVEFKRFRDSIYTLRSDFIGEYIVEHSIEGELKDWLEAELIYGLASSFSFFEVYLSNTREDAEGELVVSNNEMLLGQIESNATKYDLNELSDIKYRYLINTKASNRVPKLALDYSLLSVYQDAQHLALNEQGPYYIDHMIKNFSDNPMILKLMVNDFTKSNLQSGDVQFYEASKSRVDSLLRFSRFEESLRVLYEETKARRQDSIGNK